MGSDAVLLGNGADSDLQPAGLGNGVTPLTVPADAVADTQAMVQSAPTSGIASPVWLMRTPRVRTGSGPAEKSPTARSDAPGELRGITLAEGAVPKNATQTRQAGHEKNPQKDPENLEIPERNENYRRSSLPTTR